MHAVGQVGTGDRAGAQMQERLLLVFRHGDLGADAEEFVGLHGEAGEEIALDASVFIGTAEPLPDHGLADAGDLADLVLVAGGQRMGDGNFVMRHEAQSSCPGVGGARYSPR